MGVDISGSVDTVCCEHDNQSPDSTKTGNFLNNHSLVKKYPVP